jgi:putative ABC transport system permease protein
MLFRKMLRDLARHKTQFVSIFLMAFLGVFIYAGIGGEWMGLRKTVTTYYNQTNFASVWLYGNGFTAQDEEGVTGLAGVSGAERSLVVDAVGKFSNNPKITLHFVEKNQITKSDLISGEAFSTGKDGIWLDDRFAKAHHLAVGDQITVTYNGIALEKEIKGTVYNPEYVYLANGEGMTPDFSANGYAYLSYRDFPLPGEVPYNQMMLTTSVPAASLEARVDSALHGKDSVYLTRQNHPSYAMFQQEMDQHKSMGSIFPVAFLVIALLTILTTMTRIVTGQRTQIGTLKALGFKKRRITLHYVAYGFWVSLLGAALGAVVGPLTLPRLFYPSLSGFYTLPVWEPTIAPSFYLMGAVMVALCTLVTFLACRRVLQDTPAKALRPKAPKATHHNVLEKTALWKRLGFNLQWNIRDISRNRIRSVMAVLGVLGCVALLICAFGINDDMNDMRNWQYTDLDRFASKLTVSDTATVQQVGSVLQAVNGQAIMEDSVEIKANGVKKSGALTVTDQVTLLRHTDENRNQISLPQNGVSLSYKMANQLGVKQGDPITWHIYGNSKWVTTPVAGIYRDPASQGITLPRATLEQLGYPFKATSILSSRRVTGSYEGISGIRHTADLLRDWNNLTGAMMMMVSVLIAAACLLAVVVLYNLGILSYTEMERELATLKVVGFKSGSVRRLMLTQNLLLAAVGFLLGIPAGRLLIDSMVTTMGDSFDMITQIHPTNILLSLIITMALSVLVNLLFSRRIRRLDMVASLKGVE